MTKGHQHTSSTDEQLRTRPLDVYGRLFIFPDLRIAGAAAARCAITDELLHTAGAIHFTCVDVSFGVDAHDMRPVELTDLTTSGSEAIHLMKILPANLVHRIVRKIGDVKAA